MLFNALRRKLLYGAALLAAVLALSSSALAQATFNLRAGWNLLANAGTAQINVATAFGDTSKINAVWKWDKYYSKWAFYTPLMSNAALISYAQSKNYEVLATIDMKEGYWVNASAPFTLDTTTTNSASLTGNDLIIGWNLVTLTGGNSYTQSLADLNSIFNASAKTVKSVWAWDTATSRWKFYAPSLAAQGGTALSDYIASKGYLPFTAINASDGVWINVANGAFVGINPCSVPHYNYGDIAYPPSYLGSFPIPTPTRKLPPNVIRHASFKDYSPMPLDNNYEITLPTGCTDRVLYGTNLYGETLSRMQADGVQLTGLSSYVQFDDFSKPNWSISKLWIDDPEMSLVVREAALRNINVTLTLQFNTNDSAGHMLTDFASMTDTQFSQYLANSHAAMLQIAQKAQRAGISGLEIDWNMLWFGSITGARRDAYIADVSSLIDDVRKVYAGKLYYYVGFGAPVADAIVSKVDALYADLVVSGNPAAPNPQLSLEYFKSVWQNQIYNVYSNTFNSSAPSKPIIWTIFIESYNNWYANGFLEDGHCLNNCTQLNAVTDFSMQAAALEAAFEVLSDQTYFNTYSAHVMSAYWLTDDITPAPFHQCTSAPADANNPDAPGCNNFGFPNISESIRNKPAEGIMRQWFSR